MLHEGWLQKTGAGMFAKNLTKRYVVLYDDPFIGYFDDEAKTKVKGGGSLKDGSTRASAVAEGDRILFGKYAGTEIKIDGSDYLILKEDDILAVIGE